MLIDPQTVGDQPPLEVRRQRSPHFWEALGELWTHRRLVFALTRRDFFARYKQTVLGLGWAVVIPFLTVVVFSVFVQRFAVVDTHGVPYPVWSFVGLLPWTFFSNALSTGGLALLSNRPLLNKIYAPRAIYPISSVLLAGIDILIACSALAVVFVIYTFLPSRMVWMVPLIALVHVMFIVAIVLIVSIIVVYARDLRNALPVILQLGLFATPVVYPLSRISGSYRLLYCALNPLGPIIDAYRRTILEGRYPDWPTFGVGTASTAVLFVAAFSVFARFERGIVDTI